MRFVMVPVPSEHVREVISMVLMMSSDGRKNAVRDQGRLRSLVVDSNALARRFLGVPPSAASTCASTRRGCSSCSCWS